MTKREQVTIIAEKTGIQHKVINQILKAQKEVTQDYIKNARPGDEITFFGLGKFQVRMLPRQEFRGFGKGEVVVKPPRKGLKFKISSALKNLLTN